MQWTASLPGNLTGPLLTVPCFASFAAGPVCIVRSAAGPACLLEPADLDQAETWQMVRRFADVHPLRLLSAVLKFHPDLSDSLAAEILGLKSDYRGRADALDARRFSEAAVRLAELFDPPVHILRLFDRLGQKEDLLEIFVRLNIKRNLVREIIQDFYDLPDTERYAALEDMKQAAAEGAISGEDLRGLVRLIRFPRSEELRRQVRVCVSRMELPPGVRIEIPADLENGGPLLALEIKQANDAGRISELLRSQPFQERLGEIFQILGRD